MSALIIANYELTELKAIVLNQDERLREISLQILSNQTDLSHLAAAERQGEQLVRPIMEQGRLVGHLHVFSPLIRADLVI